MKAGGCSDRHWDANFISALCRCFPENGAIGLLSGQYSLLRVKKFCSKLWRSPHYYVPSFYVLLAITDREARSTSKVLSVLRTSLSTGLIQLQLMPTLQLKKSSRCGKKQKVDVDFSTSRFSILTRFSANFQPLSTILRVYPLSFFITMMCNVSHVQRLKRSFRPMISRVCVCVCVCVRCVCALRVCACFECRSSIIMTTRHVCLCFVCVLLRVPLVCVCLGVLVCAPSHRSVKLQVPPTPTRTPQIHLHTPPTHFYTPYTHSHTQYTHSHTHTTAPPLAPPPTHPSSAASASIYKYRYITVVLRWRVLAGGRSPATQTCFR